MSMANFSHLKVDISNLSGVPTNGHPICIWDLWINPQPPARASPMAQVHVDDEANLIKPTAWIVSGGGGGITSEAEPTEDGQDDQRHTTSVGWGGKGGGGGGGGSLHKTPKTPNQPLFPCSQMLGFCFAGGWMVRPEMSRKREGNTTRRAACQEWLGSRNDPAGARRGVEQKPGTLETGPRGSRTMCVNEVMGSLLGVQLLQLGGGVEIYLGYFLCV